MSKRRIIHPLRRHKRVDREPLLLFLLVKEQGNKGNTFSVGRIIMSQSPSDTRPEAGRLLPWPGPTPPCTWSTRRHSGVDALPEAPLPRSVLAWRTEGKRYRCGPVPVRLGNDPDTSHSCKLPAVKGRRGEPRNIRVQSLNFGKTREGVWSRRGAGQD